MHLVLFDTYERSGGKGRPRSVIGMARRNAVEGAARDWAQLHNRMMLEWGFDQESMIDHRSFASRGIERLPTIHEGPGARAMVARGQRHRTNSEWRSIDGGHSRSEANQIIKDINQVKESLDEKYRLGRNADEYGGGGEVGTYKGRTHSGRDLGGTFHTSLPFLGERGSDEGIVGNRSPVGRLERKFTQNRPPFQSRP